MNLGMDAPGSSRPLPATTPVPIGALAFATALVVAGGAGVIAADTAAVRSTSVGVPPRPAVAAPITAPEPLPRLLSETGFSDANPRRFAYTPEYPLWSDGATKRRFFALPEGKTIDASQPDDWALPVGKRVETRFSEKQSDGSVRFAAYVWDDALGDGVLAPEAGRPGVQQLAPGVAHDVPSRSDCHACHDGRRSQVLGFGALQLSSELRQLVLRGLLKNLPDALLETPPGIPAASDSARAALGYLFGNCSGCHNASGPLADLGLDFDQRVTGAQANPPSWLGASRFHLPGEQHSVRIKPGAPQASAVWFRMSRRDGNSQMPPLGSKLVDHAGSDLVAHFITHDLLDYRLNQGK
jgi:mono/diheme cytochrome c family protein